MSYRTTIARQPEALADTHSAVREELAKLDLSSLDRPVIGVTGIGASFAAAIVVAAECQVRGRRAFPIRSVDMAAGHDLCDALIGLSHRGHSVETVAALEKLPSALRPTVHGDTALQVGNCKEVEEGRERWGGRGPGGARPSRWGRRAHARAA